MHPGWADAPGLAQSLPSFHRLMRPLLRTPRKGPTPSSGWPRSAPVDFPKSRTVLGSRAGNGTIELRGVSIAGESTVFTGDAVKTGNRSYAKLALADGNKVELFADTRASFSRGPDEVRAVLTAGNLGFGVSAKPFAIDVGGFEIQSADATGGVAFLNEDYAGIGVRTGSVVVRNVRTKERFTVAAGAVQIMTSRHSKRMCRWRSWRRLRNRHRCRCLDGRCRNSRRRRIRHRRNGRRSSAGLGRARASRFIFAAYETQVRAGRRTPDNGGLNDHPVCTRASIYLTHPAL